MTSWIDITCYIDESFIKVPKAITITAPNGVGKTTSITRFVAQLSNLDIFDRIYIVVPSHEISNKIVSNLVKFGATRIIQYLGIDKVCINRKLLREVVDLGLNPSFACKVCPYNIFKINNVKSFEERLRFTVKYINSFFRSDNKVLNPVKNRPFDWNIQNFICLQPLVKYITIFPQCDIWLKNTIIIVCPYSIFASKPIIVHFRKFFKRQRAVRKYLAFFDECDSIVYSGFQYKLSKPDFTDFDYEILEHYSTERTRLTRYIDFYNKLYNILLDVAEDRVESDVGARRIVNLIRDHSRIIKKIIDLIPEISNKAFEEKKRTFLVKSVSEVFSIEYFTECMSLTVEREGEDILIQDIDFAYKVLYDVNFPFRYWWKISTTATFPQPEVFAESKITEKASELIEKVETIDIYPDNVAIFTFVLFPEMFNEYSIESRNELIEEKVDKVIELLIKSIELYRKLTLRSPNGIILFTGNKKQFSAVVEVLKDLAVSSKEGLLEINYNNIKIYLTYCASKYARGLDFDMLDISIVLAPLIRPPRRESFIDSLDVARATAEAIQSAFRIVRCLRPSRTKLLGFEANILFKKTYINALPTWFERLLDRLTKYEQVHYIRI